MSGSNKASKRESPPKSPTPSDSKGPPNIIEFIDSQASNTKSAIQRHTAQHAAAQRREARLQALREGARPRVLQWQRWSSTDAPRSHPIAASSSSSSHSPSPASQLQHDPYTSQNTSTPDLSDMSGVSALESISQSWRSSEVAHSYTSFEESVLQRHKNCFPCPHQTDPTCIENFVSNIRKDEASTYFLIAYCLALESLASRSEDISRPEKATAMDYQGRGQNILLQRLRDPQQASSDANIQAVVILITLVRDFGDRGETQIHINGLKNMLNQRGGLDQLAPGPYLDRQLREIRHSRTFHFPITCGPDCPNPVRFSVEEQESLTF